MLRYDVKLDIVLFYHTQKNPLISMWVIDRDF